MRSRMPVSKSKKVTAVYAAPGNPGMKQIATNVNISDSDVEGLVAFAKENQIDLTIVGPEHTLSLGRSRRVSERGAEDLRPDEGGRAGGVQQGFCQADHDASWHSDSGICDI